MSQPVPLSPLALPVLLGSSLPISGCPHVDALSPHLGMYTLWPIHPIWLLTPSSGVPPHPSPHMLMPPSPAWTLAPQVRLSFSSHLDYDFLCRTLPRCVSTPHGMASLCQRLSLLIQALLGAPLCECLPQPTWTFTSHFKPSGLLPALIPTACAGVFL